MNTKVHEIEKIEDTLQTGNLYYNDEEIPVDNMTPEQIYSEFSYTITGDGVYVYTEISKGEFLLSSESEVMGFILLFLYLILIIL